MPAYAPSPGFAQRRRHPRALLLIIGGHAALIAAVMTARMEMPASFIPTMTKIDLIEPPQPPPQEPPPERQPQAQPQPRDSVIDRQPALVPVPRLNDAIFDTTPIPLPPNPGPGIGSGEGPAPKPMPLAEPVRVGPRFATPDWALKPPYPDDKRRLEEEAVLKLRLSIDERGRVVAVEPVGRADGSFLQAARRHLIAKWRYKPALEDGRPVPSSTVITLRFELE
jgi:periplasmic protein TonB